MTKKADLPKIKNWANADLFPKKYEVNDQASMTVPDQSYTPEEILEKFTRGVHLDIAHEMSYSDSNDFEDVDNPVINDLTELEELMISQAMAERRNILRQKKSASGTSENIKTETVTKEAINAP